MFIHEYYYNEDKRVLYVEFSTKEDGDNFYRVLKLDYEDISYYSPDIIYESDLENLDEEYVIEIITGYLKDNDLPEELSL